MRYFAPCPFALEGVTAAEMRELGLTGVEVRENRAYFQGEQADLARALVNLRTADRIFVELAVKQVPDFNTLFDEAFALDYTPFFKNNSRILITARCVRSRLMSETDVQSVVKKAVIESLKKRGYGHFAENGEVCRLDVTIHQDKALFAMDAAGEGLHKRGYRLIPWEAPLRESMAAALLRLAWYKGGPFADPFAGSGTLAIEAAMMAARIAPNATRKFAAEDFPLSSGKAFKMARTEAAERVKAPEHPIFAGDWEEKAINAITQNAQRAGVLKWLTVKKEKAELFSSPLHTGTIVTNPPYGQRLQDLRMVRDTARAVQNNLLALVNQGWSLHILSGLRDFEQYFSKADRVRNLYNGNLPCRLYQYGSRQ